MRIHPRTRVVDKAERELQEAWHHIWTTHGLTTIEALSILQRIPVTVLKYALRHERHPGDDTGMGADEADAPSSRGGDL